MLRKLQQLSKRAAALLNRRATAAPDKLTRPGRVYLKVKIASLADEARLIRRMQATWPKNTDQWRGLRQHRVGMVRDEARCALLAYGFIRGRAYLQLEASTYEKPSWRRVAEIVVKFADQPTTREAAEKALLKWAGMPFPVRIEAAAVA